LVFLASLSQRVACHGYLTLPTSRRLQEKRSSYTGITAFGAGQHITNCGRDGLSTPSAQDIVTDLQRGSMMKFDVTIDAHHAGHMELRLCPFIVQSDDEDLSSCTLLRRASAAEAGVKDCASNDQRDICAPVDVQNPGWWFLAPKGSEGQRHSMWFHIPSDVNCPSDRCTVQFTWKTANSCNPHPAAYCNYYQQVVGPQNTWCDNWYCGGFCNSGSNSADNCEATMGNRKCCSEVFAACAEVKLVGNAEPAPVPSPTPTTTALPSFTTAAPITSTAAPASTSTAGEGQGACMRNRDCSVNAWCDDASYDTYCPLQLDCPSPQCTRETSSGEGPAPAPEPVPTPAPSQPESGPEPVTCVATPGLNRGVSDENCAQCAMGYKWWPCNEEGLCQCAGASLVQVAPHVVSKKRVAGSRKRKAFFGTDDAMIQLTQREEL